MTRRNKGACYALGLWMVWACVMGFGWQGLAWATTSWPEGVVEVMRWPVSIPTKGAWSSDGQWIAYNDRSQGEFRLFRVTVEDKSKQEIGHSKNSFFPTFGPLGLIFGGPEKDPPATLARWFRKRLKPLKKKKEGESSKEDEPSKEGESTSKKEDKLVLPQANSSGIVLFGKQHQSYLFPGWHPLYSKGARRLVFSYQGFLYLWDPLKDRRSGLLLLTRGFDPTWEPNGRAMTFLRWPFRRSDDGFVEGGGVSVVDLRFRGARLTPCGGEVAWAPDSSGVYLSASTRCLRKIRAERKGKVPQKRKPKKAKKRQRPKKLVAPPLLRGPSSLVWLSLKASRALPEVLAKGAGQASCPPKASKIYRDLVAYADKKGVWVLHRQSKQRRLIAPQASLPLWSTRGRLLVHYPKKLVVLRLRARLLQMLSN